MQLGDVAFLQFYPGCFHIKSGGYY